MHHLSTAFRSAGFPFPFRPYPHPLNPIPSRLIFPHFSFPKAASMVTNASPPAFACRGFLIQVTNQPPRSITSSDALKTIDIATFGNLCVDIVLNVPELPLPSPDARKSFMEQLSYSPPDKQYWEAGGNCNTAIAAARLGLNCITIGHVGNEIYGNFLLDVLRDEGIGMVGMSEETDTINSSNASYETILCWVLVDPLQRHDFCSPVGFSKEPAFIWMNTISEEVKSAIKRSRILFVNGYNFNEFSPDVIISAVDYAVEVGTSVFFDPGPCGKSLLRGTVEQRKALMQLLRMSNVLLLTSDEAESLTGIENPILAGQGC